MDPYTKELTALTIKGSKGETKVDYTLSDKKSLTSSATFGSIAIGANRGGGSIGTSLKSIKVSEEPLYAYSIHGKCGEEDLGAYISSYGINGSEITQPYYRYLSKDNVLYEKGSGGSTTFTLSSNNQVEEITGYKKKESVGFIVYCGEPENIDGMTVANTNKMGDRCSGKKGAYCDEDVTITTLPAGTYTIYTGLQGIGTSTFIFKAGETTIWTKEHSSDQSYMNDQHSDAFTISATSNITINGGSSSVCCDYIYIVCTSGKVASCDALGYTFSSTLPLDFTGKTVEAYTAAYNSTNKNVELTRVYKVPANTGLFIKGSADDIPVLSGDADAIGTNNLVAVSTSQTVNATTTIDETEYTNFVLGLADKNDESKGVVFVKAKSTGTIVGAGKAYLQIPTASISSARMDITFVDSETTGISTAEILDGNKGKTSREVFNLNGQRVVNPGKGLYIINGKKVLK